MRYVLRLITLFVLASASLLAYAEPEVKGFMHEAAGINFYVETSGNGPEVVLVPSGQGDSGAYKLLAEILAKDHRVITFDMPGFSRSGSPPTWENMSSETLGNQVAALVRSLGLEQASFYGSSSGGIAVLSLVADHADLVRDAVVHEPAVVNHMPMSPYAEPFVTWFPKLNKMQADRFGGFAEAERIAITQGESSDMIMSIAAYRRLGEDHIERRIKNKEIWYDRYAYPDTPCCQRVFTAAELSRAPVTVTAGMYSLGVATGGAMNLAQEGNLDLVWLPAKHFPYATIPEIVADVIKASVQEHL